MTNQTTDKSVEAEESRLQKYRGALQMLALLVGGAAVGYLAGSWLPRWGPGLDPPGPALLIPAFVLGVFLVLAVHEAGHLMGGKLVGFEFVLFVVGPVRVSREGGRIEVRLNRSLSLAGGIAASVPQDERNLRRRMAIMTAGGPLASFALALAAALPVALAGGRPGELASTLAILSPISLVIGLATLFPGRTGEFQTDGARLLMLLRGGPRADRWCALSNLTAAFMAGRRPRDWSPELVRQALAVSDGSLDDIAAAMLAYHQALDLGEVEEAGELLDRALAGRQAYPASYRPSLTLEGAYFEARYHGDAPAAHAWLEESGNPGPPIEPQTRLRAEAAVLLAEGKPEAARKRAAEGLEKIGDSSYPGSAAAEADWLREIMELAAEKSSFQKGDA